eukprot:SAG31_NODE_3954_length_3721_cov_2.949475_1_plen_75_part_00
MHLAGRSDGENVGDQPLRAPRGMVDVGGHQNVIRQLFGATGGQCAVQRAGSQPVPDARPTGTKKRVFFVAYGRK